MTTQAVANRNPAEWVEHFDGIIEGLHDEAQAILDEVQGSESGNWTDEQKARYDAIMGPQGKENEGLIGQAAEDRGRWQNILTNQQRLSQRRGEQRAALLNPETPQNAGSRIPGGVHIGQSGAFALGSNRPIIIPANARAHRPLPVGVDSPELAYAAGMWFTAALFQWRPAIDFCRAHGIDLVLDQQEIGVPGKGGYLVPTELERSVIAIRELHGIMRAHARRFPMSSETKDLPKDMAGIVVAPAAEKSDLKANNETTKDWIRPQLVARKWAGYTEFTSELDEDSIIDIGSDLTASYGRAFAKAEDNAGFNGDGGAGFNSITGIRDALLASSLVVLPVNASPAVGDLTLDHYLEALGKTPNTEDDDQAWYCHKTVWAQSIQPLAQAGGGNTLRDLEAGANTAPGGTGRRPNFMWQGYPGYWSNVMPTVADIAADSVHVIFGSIGQGVAFGDRRGVTVALSEHFAFNTDMIALRGTERFDLIVHETGTATASDPAGTLVGIKFGPAA